MNELLWLLMLILNFAMIMLFFRTMGKTGLFVWVAVSCIIANIQVSKTVILFGLEATLGNIVYATCFLATDILSEFYGKKEAKKAVYIGLFSLVCMTVLMQLAVAFTPSKSDVVSPSLEMVFSIMPRIAGASLVAYFISNLHDVFAYDFWHRKTGDKYLWLRNNASTWVSQLIDSVLFTYLAFYGIFENKTLLQIIVTTYLLKVVVAIFDTAMMYLSKYWVKTKKIPDLR